MTLVSAGVGEEITEAQFQLGVGETAPIITKAKGACGANERTVPYVHLNSRHL